MSNLICLVNPQNRSWVLFSISQNSLNRGSLYPGLSVLRALQFISSFPSPNQQFLLMQLLDFGIKHSTCQRMLQAQCITNYILLKLFCQILFSVSALIVLFPISSFKNDKLMLDEIFGAFSNDNQL